MRPVALIAALKSEATCFTGQSPLPGVPFVLDDRFTLILGGIGAERAARAANRMIENGAGSVMSIGFAGSLDPTLRSGDIVLPEQVRDDTGIVEPAASWRGAVMERLAGARTRVHGGLLTSVTSIVDSAAMKSALHERDGAVAVDMESGAILRTALEHDVPALVLRVVADTADMGVPRELLACIDSFGGIRAGLIIGTVAARPAMIPSLFRLARAEWTARRVLRRLARQRHELLAPDASAR